MALKLFYSNGNLHELEARVSDWVRRMPSGSVKRIAPITGDARVSAHGSGVIAVVYDDRYEDADNVRARLEAEEARLEAEEARLEAEEALRRFLAPRIGAVQ